MLPLKDRLEIFLKANSASGMPLRDFSTDGDLFLYKTSVDDGEPSLFVSSLLDPDTKRRMIPAGANTIAGRFSPDSRWVVAGVDYDGLENYSLCRIKTDTGADSLDVLREQTFSKVQPHNMISLVWSPDGESILYTGVNQDGYFVSRIQHDLDAKPVVVLDDVSGCLRLSWKHPDVAYLYGARPGGLQEGLITIFNPNTGKVLTKLRNAFAWDFGPYWNPVKPIIPFLEPNDEFGTIKLFDTDSEVISEIKQPDGEINNCLWSMNGEILYIGATKEGRSTVSGVDYKRDTIRTLPLPIGLNSPYYVGMREGTETLYFTHTSMAEAIDLWTYDLEQNTYAKVTNWQHSSIGTDDFPVVGAHSIHYPSSYDGLQIHGYLLLPASPPPSEGYPCIAWVHGGPISHYSDAFFGHIQVLTQEGFAVFLPNFRGSTGYGQSFMNALYQEAGRADLQDVSSGVDYICEKHPIDGKRIGIAGGSYGGYMTLVALGSQPKRWAAGFAIKPIADWTYMYDHGDAMYKEFIEYMWGDAEENRELMLERSPISRVDDIEVPLGIHASANDIRTPLAPVLEFATKLYKRNHNLALIIDPEAGHMSADKVSTVRRMTALIHLFKQHL